MGCRVCHPLFQSSEMIQAIAAEKKVAAVAAGLPAMANDRMRAVYTTFREMSAPAAHRSTRPLPANRIRLNVTESHGWPADDALTKLVVEYAVELKRSWFRPLSIDEIREGVGDLGRDDDPDEPIYTMLVAGFDVRVRQLRLGWFKWLKISSASSQWYDITPPPGRWFWEGPCDSRAPDIYEHITSDFHRNDWHDYAEFRCQVLHQGGPLGTIPRPDAPSIVLADGALCHLIKLHLSWSPEPVFHILHSGTPLTHYEPCPMPQPNAPSNENVHLL